MLSRTADNLYWLSRYMERADFLARIVQATQRLTSLPVDYGQPRQGTEWESALASAGVEDGLPQDRRADGRGQRRGISDLLGR